MNINKYTGYFHDGGVIDIKQVGDKIEFSLESSSLHDDENEDNIPLSERRTIKGKLHLEGVRNININNQSVDIIKMTYDCGDLLDFDIYENKKVVLGITWVNFPPKNRISQWQTIEIDAEKIYWENIPDLFDPMD
jgi:hypothetical protein